MGCRGGHTSWAVAVHVDVVEESENTGEVMRSLQLAPSCPLFRDLFTTNLDTYKLWFVEVMIDI